MKMKVTASIALISMASCGAFSPQKMNQRRLSRQSTFINDRNVRDSSPRMQRVDIMLLAAKIGVFFGTSTGSTEGVAEMIASEFGSDADGPFEIDGIQGSVAKKFAEYDALVVGTPTWNTGADSERSGTGWDEIYYGEMQDLNISGKKVAVFGLGDQISYSENYADASGELHDVFQDLGCKMIGYTSQEGYEHEASKAIRGDKFCGLLCDEVNQDDLTGERVENWVAQLKIEGILDGSAAAAGSAPVSVPVDVDVAVVTEPSSAVSMDSMDHIAALEAENARLRKMLEDSKMMDSVLKTEILEEGYTPHFNPKTCVTMWTSADGKKCYYTKDAPRNP